MATQNPIEFIKNRIQSLPLIDEAVWKVMPLLDDPSSTFEEIVEKLSPEIATTFLKIANSAFYGRKVHSINYAVKALGYDKMRHILISSTLINHFSKGFEVFSFEKFQNQAHFCASVAMVLGEIVEYKKPEDLFTVALLHNIGKLIIAVYFKDEYRKIIALKKSEDITTIEAEKRILGVTHAEVGAFVLQRFKIPQNIADAVRFHVSAGTLPKGSDFQLALIIREATKIVAKFSLPEEMESMEIVDRLKGTIEKGQKIYRQNLRKELIRPEEQQQAFSALIKQASELVYHDLKGLRERGV